MGPSSRSLSSSLSAAVFVLLPVSLHTSVCRCNCVLMGVRCSQRPLVLSASVPASSRPSVNPSVSLWQPPDYSFAHCHVGTALHRKHGRSIILAEEHINTQYKCQKPVCTPPPSGPLFNQSRYYDYYNNDTSMLIPHCTKSFIRFGGGGATTITAAYFITKHKICFLHFVSCSLCNLRDSNIFVHSWMWLMSNVTIFLSRSTVLSSQPLKMLTSDNDLCIFYPTILQNPVKLKEEKQYKPKTCLS